VSTYLSMEAYTADIEAARQAYREDQTAAQGLCVICERRKRDGRNRRCWTCRHRGAK
jgi:hypothetical protein